LQVTSPRENKDELRRALRRSRPDRASQLAQSAAIRRHLGEWLARHPARTIAGFAALPGEPMLLPLLEEFPGRRWVLPRVDGETMRFHFADSADLVAGSYGIQEPPADSPVCPPGEIDLFLCPGMAFTPGGIRLGRGKGYYDRALAGAAPEATKVGVCFSEQFMAELPSEPHDLPMDFLATPIGISVCP
jgi:5-formyltetrahydrofolate cyclo-ligase